MVQSDARDFRMVSKLSYNCIAKEDYHYYGISDILMTNLLWQIKLLFHILSCVSLFCITQSNGYAVYIAVCKVLFSTKKKANAGQNWSDIFFY